MYKAPRGTSDILPQEQPYWRYIEEKAALICQQYGYERLDTPIFEDARLFIRGIGEGTDIVEKETYSFEDRSGMMMTLRPEGTAPVCRAYLEHGIHNLPQPVRLYYIAPIFRYERPQAGRYRQHHQFGFEALGDADPALDAEVIDMAWQFYTCLGLRDLSLEINSIGCRLCRPGYLESLKQYYAGHVAHLCADCKMRLKKNPLRLLDCKKQSCRSIAQLSPKSIDHLCEGCKAHFNLLKRYLDVLDLPFKINHCLVRGLDYYTRTVFEIQPRGGEGAQTTLGGGGRYDDLVEELGGRPTPAVGFATGIERVILNMKRQGITVPPLPKPKIFIAHIGDGAKEEVTRLAAALRRAGIGATTASSSKSLKAQLRHANALGATQVIIIGEDEIKSGTILLRHMESGEQRSIPIGEVVKALSLLQ